MFFLKSTLLMFPMFPLRIGWVVYLVQPFGRSDRCMLVEIQSFLSSQSPTSLSVVLILAVVDPSVCLAVVEIPLGHGGFVVRAVVF